MCHINNNKVKDNYMKIIVSAILIFLSQSVFALSFEGQTKNGFFYPANQIWKVVAIKKNPESKLPERSNLGAIALFINKSNILFTDRYLTIKNTNSSGDLLVSACFEKQGNNLKVSTYGRSRKMIGENIEIIHNGDHMIMPLGEHLLLKIVKQPLPYNFKAIKTKFDHAFNYYNNKSTMRLNIPCGSSKIDTPKLTNKDLIISSDNGKTLTLKEHDLDPSTFIKYSYISYAKQVPVTNNIINGCKAKIQQFRFATSRKKRGMFYLVENINGSDVKTNKRCSKVTSMKMINTSKILDMYSINYKNMDGIILPPVGSMRFEKWDGEYAIIANLHNMATSTKLRFRISNIQTNHLKVKKIN